MKEQLLAIISDKSEIPVSDIKTTDRFKEELRFDSLDLVELCMEIEKEFNLALTDTEMEKILTVQNAIDLVESRVK